MTGQSYGNGHFDFSSPAWVILSQKITATFTWTPDFLGDAQLPPDCCITDETSGASAYWYITGGNTPGTAEADCGLPGAATLYSEDSMFGSASDTGRRVLIKNNPGTSFTVDCTPTASAFALDYGCTPFATVNYRATVFPIVVGLAGTTPSDPNFDRLWGNNFTGYPDLNILIGQGCIPNLLALPDEFGNYFAGYFDNSPYAAEHFIFSNWSC